MSNFCLIEDAYNGLYLKEPIELDILKKGTQLFGYIKTNIKEVGKIGFNIVKLPEKQFDIMMEETLHTGVLESDTIHYITFPIDSKKSSYYVTLTPWNTVSSPTYDNRQWELLIPEMDTHLIENSLTSTKKQNEPIKEKYIKQKDLKFVFNCSGVLKKQKQEKKPYKTFVYNNNDAQEKNDIELKQFVPDVPNFSDQAPVRRTCIAINHEEQGTLSNRRVSELKQSIPEVPEHNFPMKCKKLNEGTSSNKPRDISSYDVVCKQCYETISGKSLLISIMAKSVRCDHCERIVKNETVYDKKMLEVKKYTSQNTESTISLNRIKDHNPIAYKMMRDKVEMVHNLKTDNDLKNVEQEEHKGSYLDYFGLY